MLEPQLERLVRIIVQEVLDALGPQQAGSTPEKRTELPTTIQGGDVLCLFYDAVAGLPEIGRQLGYLKNRGFQIGCINLPSTAPASLLGLPWRDRLPECDAVFSAASRYKTFLIPNLSRRGLAELATGATASPMSELVYRALGRRAKVVAVKDALDPDRVQCSDNPVQLFPVQETVIEQLEKIEQLGIELIASEETLEILSQPASTGNQAEDAYRGFVTLEDLDGFKGRQIRLLRGTKMTPLAEEWLRDHKVTVRYIDPQ